MRNWIVPLTFGALSAAVAVALLWRSDHVLPPPAPAHVEPPAVIAPAPAHVEPPAVIAPAPQVQHRPTPAERRQGWEAAQRQMPPLARGLAGKLSFVPARPSKGKLPDSLAALEDAAVAGDDRAAEKLQRTLDLCRDMPKTPDELRALEARARESYAKMGGVVFGEYVGTLDEQLAHWRRYYEQCQGSGDPGVQGRTLELLRESADRGDWHNSLLYAQVLSRTDPEEGRARLEALAAKGSATALHSLGQNSLPHKIAGLSIYIAMTGPKNSEDFQKKLREIENTTPPIEYREAEQEAARLLSNPACCKL